MVKEIVENNIVWKRVLDDNKNILPIGRGTFVLKVINRNTYCTIFRGNICDYEIGGKFNPYKTQNEL